MDDIRYQLTNRALQIGTLDARVSAQSFLERCIGEMIEKAPPQRKVRTLNYCFGLNDVPLNYFSEGDGRLYHGLIATPKPSLPPGSEEGLLVYESGPGYRKDLVDAAARFQQRFSRVIGWKEIVSQDNLARTLLEMQAKVSIEQRLGRRKEMLERCFFETERVLRVYTADELYLSITLKAD